MSKVNLEEIKKHLKPCSVVFTASNDFISNTIRDAQDIYTLDKYKKNSIWSHIGFIGNDGNFYESTVDLNVYKKEEKILGLFKVKVPHYGFTYGIKITPVEERFSDEKLKKLIRIGIQTNFVFPKISTESVFNKMMEYGLKLKQNKIKYGGIELFGTLLVLLKYKMAKSEEEKKKLLSLKNPFNNSSVYCVAFVSDSFKYAGINYTDPSINSSVLTVDEAWYNCQIKKFDKFYFDIS